MRSLVVVTILGVFAAADARAQDCVACGATAECRLADPSAFCVRYSPCGDLYVCCDALAPGAAQDTCFQAADLGEEPRCRDVLDVFVGSSACERHELACGGGAWCCPGAGCAIAATGFPDCYPDSCELVVRAPDAGAADVAPEDGAPDAAPEDAGSVDASLDGGIADAGRPPDGKSCGCRASGAGSPLGAGLLVLAAALRRRAVFRDRRLGGPKDFAVRSSPW